MRGLPLTRNVLQRVLEKKEKVKVNTVLDPILVKYYKKGAWDVY